MGKVFLMPSTSNKQRMMMAIAEHHPEKLYKKNRSVLKMSHKQLHDFASSVKKRKGAKKRLAGKKF